jgi:hypothetical protein
MITKDNEKGSFLYTVKLINSEVLEIFADGYDVFYDVGVVYFYVAKHGINSKKIRYRIPFSSILYMTEDAA